MPPDDFQLPPLFTRSFGFKAPRNILGDYHLTLDPDLIASRLGWIGQPAIVGPPVLLGPSLGNGLDDSLRPALGQFSQAAAKSGGQNMQQVLNSFAGLLDDELLKKIADAINDQLATNLNVRGRTNIASGDPAAIGKVGPGGVPQYDGVDNVVPHMDLLSISKNFKFASVDDVQVTLLVDSDAVKAGKLPLIFSGVSVEVPVKTGWAPKDTKITVVGGRDQTGKPAGSLGVGFAF
jgi:hypothetical protein